MAIGKCTDVFREIFLFIFFWGGEFLGGGLRGRIFPWRNLSWAKRISMKGAQNFLALLRKNNEKINMKCFFN